MSTITTTFGVTWTAIGCKLGYHCKGRAFIWYNEQAKKYWVTAADGKCLFAHASVAECLSVGSTMVLDSHASGFIPMWEKRYVDIRMAA